ncbi:MAG: hypothetical protein Q4F28_11895 [Eubacteriales bacterium]|nr:hypothetical protein [Eubacteriales bacterium]
MKRDGKENETQKENEMHVPPECVTDEYGKSTFRVVIRYFMCWVVTIAVLYGMLEIILMVIRMVRPDLL